MRFPPSKQTIKDQVVAIPRGLKQSITWLLWLLKGKEQPAEAGVQLSTFFTAIALILLLSIVGSIVAALIGALRVPLKTSSVEGYAIAFIVLLLLTFIQTVFSPVVFLVSVCVGILVPVYVVLVFFDVDFEFNELLSILLNVLFLPILFVFLSSILIPFLILGLLLGLPGPQTQAIATNSFLSTVYVLLLYGSSLLFSVLATAAIRKKYKEKGASWLCTITLLPAMLVCVIFLLTILNLLVMGMLRVFG